MGFACQYQIRQMLFILGTPTIQIVYADNADNAPFVQWLRDTLANKGWSVMDLARAIAQQEGFGDRDGDELRRRTKSIHGNVSHILNGVSNPGDEYIRKIADGLGVRRDVAMQKAGRFDDEPSDKPTSVDTNTREKLEGLLGLLDDAERQEAIRYLTLFVQAKQQQKREHTGKRVSKKPKPAA